MDHRDPASKWNARYAYSGAPVPAPSSFLSQGVRWLPTTPADDGSRLTALDFACGRAANGQWLAERGFDVSAWDISDTVIEEIQRRKPQLLGDIQVRDVLQNPPIPESFDVIVVSRFLERGLCDAIRAALKPAGVLYYQTFVAGLSNRQYLLKPNELLQLFNGLHVLEYHEPDTDAQGKSMASLIARRQ